jgi:hypothetical protein
VSMDRCLRRWIGTKAEDGGRRQETPPAAGQTDGRTVKVTRG